MFNVAVISLKNIGKYTMKMGIAIAILLVCSKIVNRVNNNNLHTISYAFIECLDITIPGMKLIEMKQSDNLYNFKKVIEHELAMVNNLKVVSKTEEVQTEKNTENYVVPQTAQTQVLESSVKERYTNSFDGVNIKNETEFGLTEDMLSGDIQIENPKRILIYHTHTCESYTPSESYSYEMTGNYRTTDLNFSVARVGTEFAKILEKKNYTVIHDTTYHDFPAYSGSYDRSYQTVEKIITGGEKTDILIDLHRDSIGDSSYAPTVKIGEEYAAQLMFVIGTNGGGLEHPDWIQNLRVAIKIQAKANEKYPGLFKPIILRNSRYNQNLGKAACIIEVGATGNTLEQCITSMKYLAEVLEAAI